MAQQLIIVSGMYGSGKTTYSYSLGHPILHMDDYFSFPPKPGAINFDAIATFKNKNPWGNITVFDAYYFGHDRDLSGLKKVISPISDISIKMVYTTLAELYDCQRSTPLRASRKKEQKYTREEDYEMMIHNQKELVDIFTEHLAEGRVNAVDYIFREGENYTVTDKKHFLKTMEVNTYMKSPEELIEFVEQFEPGGNYQTIEVDNKIIRPGGELCWKTWENICKFDIDWPDKFVCDIGCYFGYFSTKILRAGAKNVLGLDQDSLVLPVYTEVLKANGFENFETELLQLGNGNVVPNYNYDVLLALNMLHHVQKSTTNLEYIKVLNSIFMSAKKVIFEVNNNQIDQIKEVALENNFILKTTLKSHRVAGTRSLLYFENNK